MDQREILTVSLKSKYYLIPFILSLAEKNECLINCYQGKPWQVLNSTARPRSVSEHKWTKSVTEQRHLILFPLENLLTRPKSRRRISSFRAHCPSIFPLTTKWPLHSQGNIWSVQKIVSEPQDLLITKCFSCWFSPS